MVRLRAAVPGGSVTHAQLEIAEGAVMLGRQGGEFRPQRPNEISQYVLVYVEDVEKHFEHARQRGARILKSPADMPFGEPQYTVEDLGGHRWTVSQSVPDVAPEGWGATLARPGWPAAADEAGASEGVSPLIGSAAPTCGEHGWEHM